MIGKEMGVKKEKVEKWEIEGWVRTLKEAEQIKSDPKKMKLIQPFLKKEIECISDLKELISNKGMDDDSEY